MILLTQPVKFILAFHYFYYAASNIQYKIFHYMLVRVSSFLPQKSAPSLMGFPPLEDNNADSSQHSSS